MNPTLPQTIQGDRRPYGGLGLQLALWRRSTLWLEAFAHVPQTRALLVLDQVSKTCGYLDYEGLLPTLDR